MSTSLRHHEMPHSPSATDRRGPQIACAAAFQNARQERARFLRDLTRSAAAKLVAFVRTPVQPAATR
jgi:hypothetical protein